MSKAAYIDVHRVSTATFLKALEALTTADWKNSPLRQAMRRKRRRFGITVYTVAYESGWNYLYVTYWDNGSRTPKPHQLDDWMGAINRLVAEGPNLRHYTADRRDWA